MAKRDFIINIDLNNNELLNAVFHNSGTEPTAKPEGFVYYNTANERVWVYSPNHPDANGTGWVDLTSIYTHYLTPLSGGALTPDLTTNKVLSGITITSEGHIDAISTRILTLANLGYTGATDANNYVHPNDGMAGVPDLTGATVIKNITVNASGHVTDFTTRDLTNADIGSLIINDSVTNATHTWSSTKIATEIANAITAGMTYKGPYDAATNTPLLDVTPISTEIGDTYTVTTSGSFFTELVEPGDMLIANVVNATAIGDWTIVQTNIDAATEAIPGYIQIATQAEVNTGTNDTKSVTPLKLAVYVAAQLAAEIPTTEELQDLVGAMVTGNTETHITVTYQDADGTLDFVVTEASTTAKGVIEIATQTEVNTGTDALRAVTPLTLQAKLDAGIAATSFAADFGDGVLQTFPIAHGMATKDINVQIYENSNGRTVEVQEDRTSISNLQLSTNSIPTVNQYRVIVSK